MGPFRHWISGGGKVEPQALDKDVFGDGSVVIVSADATSAHQSVINVLDAARRAGLPRLTFATQLPADAPAR